VNFVDDPYRLETLPVVPVALNGRMVLVPVEVVGRGAVQAAFGVPRGCTLYNERDGHPVGYPLIGPVHVFHLGDRFVVLYPCGEREAETDAREEAA